MGLLGFACGGLFLWLALRQVRWADITLVVERLEHRLLLEAALVYWLGIALRVLRWRLLLRELGAAPLGAVAETLVVGYAVNTLLPARLGEVARAAYAKRRLAIGRARVFGSIVIERLLDLVAIATCLGCGLFAFSRVAGEQRLPTFELFALNAGAAIGLAILGVAWLRAGGLQRFPLPPPLRRLFDDFVHGVATLNRRSLGQSLFLTAAVWTCEVTALAWVFLALGVPLAPGEAVLVMGAASLSTLVPTAPGYLGTYQLVAVLAMDAFGHDATAGAVAATAIQVVLFGSVAIAGTAILGVRARAPPAARGCSLGRPAAASTERKG